ncbi:CoA transferase [Roseomonas alkaliterrae]|uniref:Formyl-CoA transferase n=1 Tax=Neoroseomonas alkaliterrae TaxID=1452450 RepID=A0A840YBQ0_9PROT|nr:CoA transferase [Neoroseomonas alkaliterrae]MBB5691304.1 formyl-CoA transferase [Neoroseomonas alkaliterrae]MBR0676684.1 CoA transferase [Neoroseomonas alkaliterrae]
MDEAMRPYRGIRVLDAGQGIAGPYCGMMLAACGADVIKLEPAEGDWSRGLGTAKDGVSVMTVCFNRGKRSVVLDLKSEEGRRAAAKLAASADVLIEAFRPGVAARIGLGPENAKADAVCLSISGFGQTGPYAERPCTDSVAQAFSGMVALNEGADGVPHKVGAFISDMATGIYAFSAVQVALAARAQDAAPRRRVIDMSLMAATSNLLTHQIAEWGFQGGVAAAPNVPAGAYRAADGAWVMVTLVREAEWLAICDVLGIPEAKADPRFADFKARWTNREALYAIIRAAFATRPSGEWIARLQGARLLADRVNTPLDWLANEHVLASGAAARIAQPQLGEVPLPALPGLGHWRAEAPALGQHTAEVLAELGA